MHLVFALEGDRLNELVRGVGATPKPIPAPPEKEPALPEEEPKPPVEEPKKEPPAPEKPQTKKEIIEEKTAKVEFLTKKRQAIMESIKFLKEMGENYDADMADFRAISKQIRDIEI
jgi:hypothetical protein